MTPAAPEVSVIIPTRDRHDRLPATLACALEQEAVDCEIVVVDDGSRRPVVASAAGEGRPVRVLRNETACGVAQARNRGVANARGTWLAFLDDDDLWAPMKLRRQLDAAKEAGAGFAFAAGIGIDDGGQVLYADDVPPTGTDVHRSLLARNIVPAGCSNVIAEKALVARVGAFDPALSTLADWDLHVRLSAASVAGTVPERLVAYRVHDTNMHLADELLDEKLAYFDAKHAPARERLGVAFDREWWLRGRVTARRATGDRGAAAAALWELGRLSRSPGLLARAGIVRLGGERALRAVRRLRDRPSEDPGPAAPEWVLRASNRGVHDQAITR